MKNIIFLFFSLFLFSCGTIVDSSKLIGEWTLTSVNYYTYNEDLDSYKKISGINAAVPTTTEPLNRSFFCGIDDFDESGVYTWAIEFKKASSDNEKNSFYVTAPNDEIFISESDSSWELNSYENSLSLKVDATDDVYKSLWETSSGLNMKNYWPLASNTSLEITLDSKDFNREYFNIDLTQDKILKVKYMKAVFTKSS
jgi:hypothetical protein